MKLQQLRYIVEVANSDLNVSITAEKLYTSQPGISKQIKLLEEELNLQIFTRNGKQLTDITPVGKKIISIAREMLIEANAIKAIAKEFTEPNQGRLSITTNYTQARYSLPTIVPQFMQKYPQVALHVDQNSSHQSMLNIKEGHSDFAIVSGLSELSNEMIALPCYHWNYVVIVMKDHKLASNPILSIEQLANYPLVSYDFSNDDSDLNQTFIKAGLSPNIVFNTSDAELIKTYVRLGVGVGIVAKMAIDETIDNDFVVINTGHIFPYNTNYLVFLRTLFLSNYMYDFINLLSIHLDKKLINKLLLCENNNAVLAQFNGMKLPVY